MRPSCFVVKQYLLTGHPGKAVRVDFGWLHKTIVYGIAGTTPSRGVRSLAAIADEALTRA
jgi:PleD family two-component response regulator